MLSPCEEGLSRRIFILWIRAQSVLVGMAIEMWVIMRRVRILTLSADTVSTFEWT